MRRSVWFLVLVVNFVVSTVSWGSTKLFEEKGFLEYLPKTFLTGTMGYQGRHEGNINLMLPFNTELFISEIFSYGMCTGYYGNQGHQVGVGGGVRYSLDGMLILGAYSLVEYEQSMRGNGFWRISPGLEAQWGPWSLFTNAYLPIRENDILIQRMVSGTDMKFADLEGHKGFLTKPIAEKEIREAGIKGFDIVGRWQFNDPLSFSLGAYYVAREEAPQFGIVTGLVYQIYPGYTLAMQGHYNSKEIDVRAQVNIQLDTLIKGNGVNKRNNAGNKRNVVANGVTTPMLQRIGAEWAVPEVYTRELSEKRELENLYFFHQDGKGSICTAEEPCGEVLREVVEKMPERSYILLAKSNAPYKVKGPNRQDLNILTLKNSQSILGRSADFKQYASDDDRPILQSALTIKNSTGVLVDRIHINPAIEFEYGIWVDQSQYTRLHHIIFGAHRGVGELETSLKIERSRHVEIVDISGFSSEMGFEVSKSYDIKLKHSQFKIDGNSDRHIGLWADSDTAEFEAAYNTFYVLARNSDNIISIYNREGAKKKFDHNKFELTYKGISNEMVTGSVVTHLEGSNRKQLIEGEEFTDQGHNLFRRNQNLVNNSSSGFKLPALFSTLRE